MCKLNAEAQRASQKVLERSEEETEEMSSYPKEHRDKAEEAWFQQKRKPPTTEELAQYETEYVYGSHLQPGLERTPEYLTSREKQVQRGEAPQLYRQSLEQRSGIAVRGEERSIAEQQYQERLARIQARGVQGPVSFEDISKKLGVVQANLAGTEESLTILQYKIKGYHLVERREGALVFAMPEPPRGIAETLAGFTTKPLIGYFGIALPAKTLPEFVKPRETVAPFAGIAAYIVTPTERLVYSFGSLVGLKTPRIPPTMLSFSAEERARAMEYGPEYAAGSIAGDVLLSIVFGKVAGTVWEHVPKFVKAPLGKFGEAIAKPFRPITEPIMSRLEKAALWPYERVATGIVNIPTPERIGLEGMEAQFTAWELAEAPKSSAYLISKMPGEPLAKAWATEHIFKTVTGGLSYALVKEQLGATALPTMPYLPKAEAFAVTSKGLAQAFGVAVVLFPKALPRQREKQELTFLPTLGLKTFEEPYELQRLKMFPQAYPRQRQKERVSPMLTLTTGFESLTETVSVPSLALDVPQMARQEQRQLLMPMLKMPTPHLPKQALSFPTFSKIPSIREPSFKGLGGGLFGKWFKRTHSIPTEKQIMRELGFSTGRKKGKTEKRRHKQHKRAKR